MNRQDELFEALKLAKAAEAAAGERARKLEIEHEQAVEKFAEARRASRRALDAIEHAAISAPAS